MPATLVDRQPSVNLGCSLGREHLSDPPRPRHQHQDDSVRPLHGHRPLSLGPSTPRGLLDPGDLDRHGPRQVLGTSGQVHDPHVLDGGAQARDGLSRLAQLVPQRLIGLCRWRPLQSRGGQSRAFNVANFSHKSIYC